jgi:hypothetical protein
MAHTYMTTIVLHVENTYMTAIVSVAGRLKHVHDRYCFSSRMVKAHTYMTAIVSVAGRLRHTLT